MAASKLNLRPVLVLMLAMVFLAAGLSGCPFYSRASALDKIAVLCSGNLAPQLAVAKGTSGETLSTLHLSIESIALKHQDGTPELLVRVPVEAEISPNEDGGHLIAADTDLIRAGVYIGGTVTISSAKAEFVDNPGVLVPIALSQDGEFSVPVQFKISPPRVQGVVTFDFGNIEIVQLDDLSLALDMELHLDADIERGKIFQRDLAGGNVKTYGLVYSPDPIRRVFGMSIGGCSARKSRRAWNLRVNYARSSILLPPAGEGGETIQGTPADLVEDACVRVTGTLGICARDIVLTADTVQILAYN